ncbi:hypothetical protein AJ80_09884 [Polytolypa hystricis UAMH7299]|uniref:Uncharacterized protein n=1 Tax=Polytolypa hystricis (strain UAMH7299) TaxID=1447883 RepID=A0A2B7WHH1_POLH7|nr:hypothetical protein AJ80_09884 [Polytolypa hystricis UAMH7299]
MEPHKGLVDNRLDMLSPPKTVRKRRSAEANLNANQPTEAPAIRLSQPSNLYKDSDTDSAVYMLTYFKQEQKRKRKEQQERGIWVNRAIKCCNCDRTSSTTNKCECGHVRCGTCFHYSDKPDAGAGGFKPAEEVPDCDHDDIWQTVKSLWLTDFKATHQEGQFGNRMGAPPGGSWFLLWRISVERTEGSTERQLRICAGGFDTNSVDRISVV